jgi:hypothetical protein
MSRFSNVLFCLNETEVWELPDTHGFHAAPTEELKQLPAVSFSHGPDEVLRLPSQHECLALLFQILPSVAPPICCDLIEYHPATRAAV